jgi:transcriptional regulator GlxA family with amidase domain
MWGGHTVDDNAPLPVRAEWLYEAARASQEVLCEIRAHALGGAQVATSLKRLPEATTPVERLLLQGLILEILLGCVPDRSRSPAERTADILRRILEGALRPPPLLDSSARRAADLIRQNYADPLDSPAIARTVGCELTRLRRLFKAEIGMKMQRFHARMRAAAALAMFGAGVVKTSAIARCVGYRSDKGLYRALREATNLRPGALRSMSREALEGMRCQILARVGMAAS